MTVALLANVDPTQTDTGIQRRYRSLLTSDRAAAGLQPSTSARGDACEGRNLAFPACHRDR